MKVKSITSTISRNNALLPSPTDMLRLSTTRPSVLDVNNLLCPKEAEDHFTSTTTTTVTTTTATSSLKTKRKRATPTQLQVLNRVFNETFFPSTELRFELGKQLGMSPRTVQIWFQNKRQSIRTRDRTIPRHHQRRKSSSTSSTSSSTIATTSQQQTPPISPPPLSPPAGGPVTPSYFTSNNNNSQILPPPTSLYHHHAFSPSPPLATSRNSITLPPLRLPCPSPCWPSSSIGTTTTTTSPLSSTSSFPSPTSIDAIIYRD